MTRRGRWAFALLALIAFLAGCSGPGGVLDTNRYPKGNIAAASYPGGVPLTTSPTAPYLVDSTFSISLSETDFGGPYTITMYSWNDRFNEPCFEPHSKTNTIYTFSPDNAAAAGAPNPCAGHEVETALITDGDGHDFYFSFESTQAITSGPTPAPTVSPSSGPGGLGAACSQGDPNYSSVTVTGAQQPLSFPPCNDYTITGTLPANGSADDSLGLATSGSTTFGDSTTAANGTPILALALEPSPSQITFSNTALSLTTSITSPSKLTGGTYTMELRENDSVIETIGQIAPAFDTITFNIHPVNGTFDLAQYVAIVYKN